MVTFRQSSRCRSNKRSSKNLLELFPPKNQRQEIIPETPGTAGFAPLAPRVRYYLVYTNPNQPGVLTVTIDQYPNPAWARYEAKYQNNPNMPDYVTIVTKFGQRIYVNSSQWDSKVGGLIFDWPSGTAFVHLSYVGTDINEEILKRYLEKYPSSL